MSCRGRIRAPLTLAAWGLLAGAALAVAPTVQDQGKFFSPEALKKADEQVREIYRKHNLDLLVETYNTVPGEDLEKLKAMDKERRSEFFRKWAADRARDRVVNGVYVVITREPRHLQVILAGRGEKAFPNRFRDGLAEAFIGDFSRGRFDDGLQAAVRLVEQQASKSGAK